MQASANITGLVVLVAGCTAIAMFVVGIVIGRRAERRARGVTDDGESSHQIIEQLRQLTEGAHAPVTEEHFGAEALPADVASIATPAPKTSRPNEPAEAARQQSIVTAVQQVVRRGLEAERKLAVAQLHLDEQNQAIRQHADAARTDALTGLINRGAFDEAIARRTAESARTDQTLSLALYDIDHFKQCNDQYGHQVGDTVLSIVAGVIDQQAREMDIVARYGGEEFAVVMPATSVEWAVRGAERIRQAVSEAPLPEQLRHLTTTVSVGVSEFQVGDTPETLIARADEALYASKHAGRNRTTIHDGRTTRPVATGGIVRPEEESWQSVAAELKAKLGQMTIRPGDSSRN